MVPVALSQIPNGITKYAIPVLGIAALGGVAYVGYQFLKTDDIPKLETNPKYPPSELSSVEAQAIAETLYTSMASTFAANKSETAIILNALNGLTQNDFVKVYKAFGAKQYSKFWKNDGDPVTSDKHSLLVWLSSELSADNFQKIKQIIPEAMQLQTAA